MCRDDVSEMWLDVVQAIQIDQDFVMNVNAHDHYPSCA